MLVPSNGRSKEEMKYKDLWSKIRDLIRSITKNSDYNNEKYMKIKFNADDKLPLNKAIEISTITIVLKAIFHENNHPQVFLDECQYIKNKSKKYKEWKVKILKKLILKIVRVMILMV